MASLSVSSPLLVSKMTSNIVNVNTRMVTTKENLVGNLTTLSIVSNITMHVINGEQPYGTICTYLRPFQQPVARKNQWIS